MNTFLLTWNPKKWDWKSLNNAIKIAQSDGKIQIRWSVGRNKKIREGDHIFLIKLGETPRGIIGSGWVQSEIFSDSHWDVEARQQGKQAFYVYVDLDTLLDSSDVFPIEQLEQGVLGEMHWTPQSSGVLIPAHVAGELERVWAEYTNQPIVAALPALAEELEGRTFLPQLPCNNTQTQARIFHRGIARIDPETIALNIDCVVITKETPHELSRCEFERKRLSHPSRAARKISS